MITRLGSGGPWEDAYGYSRVVQAGPWVLSAGCTATVGGEHADAVGRAHGSVFGEVRPVATMVMVERLVHPDMLVEVEVEAYLP